MGGNPANKIDPLGLIECRRGYVPDPKGSGGCVPTDKVDPQRCVTAECAAGLPYKESDLRTQCQIDKDLCVFNCQISTAFAGIIANRIIDGGLIGAGVIMGERKSMCELACGIEHGF